jgi:ArsR family metal-binding transcriptional regulator
VINDEEELLRGFTTGRVMDCIADSAKNRVIAEFWDEVREVFAYLNAVWLRMAAEVGISGHLAFAAQAEQRDCGERRRSGPVLSQSEI